MHAWVHEKLFHEDWAEKLHWEESRVFQTWPQYPAQELLNGQALRTAGRSPAVDVYTERGPPRAQTLRPLQLLQDALANRRNDHERIRKGQHNRLLCHAWLESWGRAASASHHHKGDSTDRGWPLIAKDGAALKDQLLQAGILKSENGLESLDLPALQLLILPKQALLCDERAFARFLLAALQAALAAAVAAVAVVVWWRRRWAWWRWWRRAGAGAGGVDRGGGASGFPNRQ